MEMTNEEAIKILKQFRDRQGNSSDDIEALNMAIKALEQEPCEDAISRDAVITKIEDEDNLSFMGVFCDHNAAMGFRETIKELPSVTPQQTRWIPVTERLPEAYEFVNCTCHSLIDDREDWVIETVYIPQPSDSPYSDWGNIPMLNSGDCKVVAWMHRDISEPYKAESEE